MDYLFNAACTYIDLGLRVIALTGKTPNVLVHRHGIKDAFSSLDESVWDAVYDAFHHPDTTGIGIETGYPTYVVDIDGEAGAAAWLELVGRDLVVPDSWVAKTGRGLHIYYRDEGDWPTTKLAPLLDFKGRGGYVAAPPSIHPDGHRYKWIMSPSEQHPMEMPDPLRSLLADAAREHEWALQRKAASKGMQQVVRHKPLEDGILYASVGWDGVVEGMLTAPDGNRNNYLHWAAATMSEEHATDDDYQCLFDAAITAGLTREETLRTIRSARRG